MKEPGSNNSMKEVTGRISILEGKVSEHDRIFDMGCRKMGKENKNKIFFGALIFISLPLLLLLSSSIAYAAELTPPLPGAPNYIDISVEKAYEMVEGNLEEIILLDVRTEGEYNAEYIPGAINIPLSDLENRIDELDSSKAIIVYCQSGGRSRAASETLAQRGFIVYNMEGGINAWKEKFATSTSTPKPTHTPAPTLSPAVATATLTPSPAASHVLTPMPVSEGERRRIPGFEASVAIMILFIFTLFMLLRMRGE
ncbi:MAG: hypothetical protein C4B56_04565 [Candidatus Methanophagaceae archaeon]|nr:MAG: hypothetical protein C4B56_04565 [Methanophagales archaeon]